MKKLYTLFLVLAMMLGAFTGCTTPSDQPQDDPAPTNDASVMPGASEGNENNTETTQLCTVSENANITVVHWSDVTTLLPIDQTTIVEGFPSNLGYECLLTTNQATGEQIWMLATGCELSEDGLTYTFKLREGITFSDGAPWNAEAMKANIDFWTDTSRGFKGTGGYSHIAGAEVVDEYSCAITLSRMDAAFLTNLGNGGYMISPTLIEAGSEVWTTGQVGTGQYILTDFRSGESMTFTLNRDWWGYEAGIVPANAGFNTITIKYTPEEATRIAMLLSGDADVIMSVSPNNVETVESTGIGKVLQRTSTMIGYLNFNLAHEPLNDVRVRHAIAHAIDLEQLNQTVFGGANVVARSLTPDTVNYFVPQTPYEYDIEKAKALLAEAGYADGFDAILWSENDGTDVPRADFIRQQLALIGINVEVKCMDAASITAGMEATSVAEQEWDFYMRGYSSSSGDSSNAMGRFRSDRCYPAGDNFPCYQSEEFDKYALAGETTIDPDERLAAYTEAQRIIWEDLPALPTLVSTSRAAINNRLDNVGFKNNGNVDLRWAVYTGE